MAETAHTSWYRQGTVGVTSGSTKVTGSNTKWLTAGINPGATFRLDGWPYGYEVATVVSDTEIQLARPYYGSTLSNQSYSIDRNFQSELPADLAARVAAVMGKYENYIDTDMAKVTGESAYQIAKRLGKTSAATEAAFIDELKAGTEYTALKNNVAALIADGAGEHNSHFFNASMGAFTDEISANIRNGSFKDIFPGKYFSFSNVPYSYLDENDETQESTYSGTMRVLDLDYFLRCGDSDLSAHHIVVAPDTSMFSIGMNDTNTTEGGYVGSKMRTKHLRRAEAIFKACFGADHLLAHREYLVNAVADGKPSAGAWCDSLVELMDERMVYGSLIFDSGNPDGTNVPNRYSLANAQLNAFRHAKYLISNRQYYWLRNVVSAAVFANVNYYGDCYYSSGSYANGVRPFALIY
mgnify:CR=1 FL=1